MTMPWYDGTVGYTHGMMTVFANDDADGMTGTFHSMLMVFAYDDHMV